MTSFCSTRKSIFFVTYFY